ncbi:MAG: hypothetical protein JRH01_05995 [Deltaproteobacteria bacterium]|nr:hypothetical protein [Deltaproteobacteria bacterium]
MKRVVLVVGSVLGLVAIFYASLFAFAELYTEIVVLRTFDADGESHETRVTVIDVDNTPWVRGRPYRGWFQRIEANHNAELYRGGAWYPVKASVSRNLSDAAEFERVMVERYGLTYRCFDFIARMSSNEIPVRLEPRNPKRPTT